MLTRRTLFGAAFGAAAVTACRQSAAAAPAVLRLTAPRAAHHVIALNDGAVLFIGGCVRHGCEQGPASATIDRYDPVKRAISEHGRLLAPRISGAVALLGDGTVLLAGGWTGASVSASVERYDPVSRSSRSVGAMAAPQTCAIVPLADGRALLLGEQTVEIFDRASESLSVLAERSMFFNTGTATLLDDGSVLVAGGGPRGEPRAKAYLVDPESGSFTETGSLAGPRWKHAAIRLSDGRVLIVGGSDARDRDGGKTRVMEVYNPDAGEFEAVGRTLDARYKIPDAALRLSDRRVLIAGGADRPEIVDTARWTARHVDVSFGGVFNFQTAARLPDGGVIVAGGYSERGIQLTDRAVVIPAEMLG